ncbi:hypothetical protein IMY05_C4577000100 [Salix suchowensis]|nr:hypothetical protein IMY05_C4577000100 [Salix suchowensis]
MSIYDSSDYSDSPSPPRTSAETSDNSDSSDNDIITLFPPIQPIAQFHDSQESSVNGFNHPRNTPPNRKYQPTSMFATPNDIAPGELMYELITDAPDPWNYNDATTTVLQLMTVPPMPTTSYPKYISQPPDDHPYWRNNHTKFERIRSIVKYDGSYDNHPLRTWSNACVELDDYYHIDWQEDGDTDLAQMVLDICEAARKGVLRPLYWEYIDGPPEYVLKARDAVNCVYANLRGHFEDLNSCSACTSNHAYEPLVSVTGNRILSYNIAIQPEDYGQIASFNYYVNHYRNPWISPNPVIAFNPWNVKITYLRRIRIDILQFFRQLIDYMFTTEFRDWVDSPRGAGDMRHYFYHHCPFYRFLDHHTPLMFQGFSRDCLHTEFNTQSWTRRSPTPPPTLYSLQKRTNICTTLAVTLKIRITNGWQTHYDIFEKQRYLPILGYVTRPVIQVKSKEVVTRAGGDQQILLIPEERLYVGDWIEIPGKGLGHIVEQKVMCGRYVLVRIRVHSKPPIAHELYLQEYHAWINTWIYYCHGMIVGKALKNVYFVEVSYLLNYHMFSYYDTHSIDYELTLSKCLSSMARNTKIKTTERWIEKRII